MGTKNNPGIFDCYDKAESDEPIFVLLARDPNAAILVSLWAEMAELNGENSDKITEAKACAKAMDKWRIENNLNQNKIEIPDGN